MLGRNTQQKQSSVARGFTIVELLIVIVVIGILAAITIVAYNGIQQRSVNTSRASDITSLQKALELFRADHGRYPYTNHIGTNTPSGFVPRYGAGYAYSVATNDSWMKELKDSGLLTTAPVDPVNDNDHYYIYWSAESYGSCTEPFYVLVAYGWEGGVSTMPENAQSLNCNASGVGAHWVQDNKQAVFSNLNRPTAL